MRSKMLGLVCNAVIVSTIMLCNIDGPQTTIPEPSINVCQNTHSVGEQQNNPQVQETSEVKRPEVSSSLQSIQEVELIYSEAGTTFEGDVKDVQTQLNNPSCAFDQCWSDDDKYLIAKLVKCEAGNKTLETKCKIIQTIYNRIYSNEFPDTISEVIYQHNNGTYQFSPVTSGGSWWSTEPDESCYQAVESFIESKCDPNDQVLYFESLPTLDYNWHWNNLTFLYQLEDMRFYK